MIVKQPKYRKQLSKNQVELLGLICKFRFVTVPLVAAWRNKNKSTVYERLLVLTEQGYLHKTYDKSWRLLGKPAVYSLSAKGIKAVRTAMDGHFIGSVLKNQYKNSSASLQLVDHSVAIATLCLQLKRQYGNTMQTFTKAELAKYDDELIRPLPDLYLRVRQKQADQTVHYQLEIIEAGTMSWLIRKRINAHQEWFDDNNEKGWVFEDNYPTLLLVCGNTNTEKRAHRLADDMMFDFAIYTTTNERFESRKKDIWLQYWDDELEFSAL